MSKKTPKESAEYQRKKIDLSELSPEEAYRLGLKNGREDRLRVKLGHSKREFKAE